MKPLRNSTDVCVSDPWPVHVLPCAVCQHHLSAVQQLHARGHCAGSLYVDKARCCWQLESPLATLRALHRWHLAGLHGSGSPSLLHLQADPRLHTDHGRIYSERNTAGDDVRGPKGEWALPRSSKLWPSMQGARIIPNNKCMHNL